MPDPDLHSPFDELIGTRWVSDDPDDARLRLSVRDDLRQPAGLVHGGVLSSLVESLCSRATYRAVKDQGQVAMGQSHSISFLRPVTEGEIEVRARARHRGSTTWVWDAEVVDSQDRLCALAQFTVAVRPRPGS
jgi:1,4-dihydroxy-2-naphthoyl-CoA hydrolase